MYRNTRFGDLLKALPRGVFDKHVETHQTDRFNKGFKTWDQLITLVYAQLSGCQSLREIETAFNSQSSLHYHLGSRSVKRSTLSDSNARRNPEVFGEACRYLMQNAHRKLRRDVKDFLYLMDSTPINLKGPGFDEWVHENKTYRTQGLKAHVVLASHKSTPVRVDLTAPNINDIQVGRLTEIEPGATYAFDKGYYDYNWWYRIHTAGAYFVTRLKKNAGVKVLKNVSTPDKSHVLDDVEIAFKHKHPGGKRLNDYYGKALRRVTIERPDKNTPLVLVTNDFTRTAAEIGEVYKRRWEIELFFKWLKQHLKIKRFLGRTENAVRIQIYTALIAYLLVYFYHDQRQEYASLNMCLVSLRFCLFQRPELDRHVEQRRRNQAREFHRQQGVLPI